MTALIWMLALLPQVVPAPSELPPPVNLTLNSSRFVHILHWEPGPGTPTGVHYNVTVCDDMDASCMPAAGCQRVQHPLVCNLTQAFSDLMQGYLTWVTAGLEAQASHPVFYPEFKPIRDTDLDPPRLTVTPCDRHLCVDLQPPVEHLRNIYEMLGYKLRINGVEKTQDTLGRTTQEHVARGREYCVSVCFSNKVVDRKSNYSRPVCVFTPADYNADALISAGLCLLVMAVVAMAALLVAAGYICLTTRPLPLVLTSIQHMEDDLLAASLTSFLIVRATPPPSGHQKTSWEESDEESLAEGSRGSAGRCYQLPGGARLPASSSSSSSLPAPLPPEASPPSDQESDRGETSSGADPPADAPTAGGVENKEAVGEEGSQDVDLLTLTFGVEEEEEKEEDVSHEESSSASKVAPDLPAQTARREEEEEEEEEKHSEYITHPSIHDLQSLM